MIQNNGTGQQIKIKIQDVLAICGDSIKAIKAFLSPLVTTETLWWTFTISFALPNLLEDFLRLKMLVQISYHQLWYETHNELHFKRGFRLMPVLRAVIPLPLNRAGWRNLSSSFFYES